MSTPSTNEMPGTPSEQLEWLKQRLWEWYQEQHDVLARIVGYTAAGLLVLWMMQHAGTVLPLLIIMGGSITIGFMLLIWSLVGLAIQASAGAS